MIKIFEILKIKRILVIEKIMRLSTHVFSLS